MAYTLDKGVTPPTSGYDSDLFYVIVDNTANAANILIHCESQLGTRNGSGYLGFEIHGHSIQAIGPLPWDVMQAIEGVTDTGLPVPIQFIVWSVLNVFMTGTTPTPTPVPGTIDLTPVLIVLNDILNQLKYLGTPETFTITGVERR